MVERERPEERALESEREIDHVRGGREQEGSKKR